MLQVYASNNNKEIQRQILHAPYIAITSKPVPLLTFSFVPPLLSVSFPLPIRNKQHLVIMYNSYMMTSECVYVVPISQLLSP